LVLSVTIVMVQPLQALAALQAVSPMVILLAGMKLHALHSMKNPIPTTVEPLLPENALLPLQIRTQLTGFLHQDYKALSPSHAESPTPIS
jgi:hypothetical protein